MGKISPVSIKYIVYANFEAEGNVEKPDVIGALFGQTEGLLGSELEMRELQKEGKIGRIEVNLETIKGKTRGKIEIPSALDKAETALIAAAVETIDRIGPTDAKITIEKIEDVRGEKRDYIVDRAKKLLEKIEGTSESREIENAVKDSSRTSRIKEYGTDNLSCGDLTGEEIIVVEGRADVVNLLKSGVNNVIAMNGTILPETVKQLSLEKNITLFVDGDRGGKLIAKNVSDNARVDFVAVAPDGKEVEELVGKEILIALRRKIPIREFFREDSKERSFRNREERFKSREPEEIEEETRESELTEKEKEKISEMMNAIEGNKTALLLDNNLEVIREVSSNAVSSSLLRIRKKVYAIVFDGLLTSGIIRNAEEKQVQVIAAKNFASTDTKIKLISL